MVIGVLASMAEFERELVKERTALRRSRIPRQWHQVGAAQKLIKGPHRHSKADEGRWSHRRDIAKYLGVSRATLYRYLTVDGAA